MFGPDLNIWSHGADYLFHNRYFKETMTVIHLTVCSNIVAYFLHVTSKLFVHELSLYIWNE